MDMVGGFIPLENMKVNWDDYSQDMEKYNMFQTTNQMKIERTYLEYECK